MEFFNWSRGPLFHPITQEMMHPAQKCQMFKKQIQKHFHWGGGA